MRRPEGGGERRLRKALESMRGANGDSEGAGLRAETERRLNGSQWGRGAWSRAETVSGRAETLSTTVDSGSAASELFPHFWRI